MTFTGESASGWQEDGFLLPDRGDRGHHRRRLLLRAEKGGYTHDTGAGLCQHGSHERAADGTSVLICQPRQRRVQLFRLAVAFPSGTYNAANYWVDVVFTTTSP